MEINSQYIDSNGKCRFINVENSKITVVFSTPIAPLSVSETTKWSESSVEEFYRFKDRYNLVLTGYTLEKGVWVKFDDFTCFIPLVQGFKLIEDLPEIKQFPLVLIDKDNSTSTLSKYSLDKKIAQILKNSAIQLYSEFKDEYKAKIVVGKKRGDVNNELSFFDDKGNLIVQSKKIKNSLITIVESKILNSKASLQEYYSDYNFKMRDNELVFNSQESLLLWLNEPIDRYKINDILDLGKKDPYAYKNANINKNFFLIQNVQKYSRELAITVSYLWIKEKKNVGYGYTDVLDNIDDIEYTEFDINGPVETLVGKERTDVNIGPKIIVDNFKYAAILDID
jgi:hypothetical protein